MVSPGQHPPSNRFVCTVPSIRHSCQLSAGPTHPIAAHPELYGGAFVTAVGKPSCFAGAECPGQMQCDGWQPPALPPPCLGSVSSGFTQIVPFIYFFSFPIAKLPAIALSVSPAAQHPGIPPLPPPSPPSLHPCCPSSSLHPSPFSLLSAMRPLRSAPPHPALSCAWLR